MRGRDTEGDTEPVHVEHRSRANRAPRPPRTPTDTNNTSTSAPAPILASITHLPELQPRKRIAPIWCFELSTIGSAPSTFPRNAPLPTSPELRVHLFCFPPRVYAPLPPAKNNRVNTEPVSVLFRVHTDVRVVALCSVYSEYDVQ